MGSIAKISRCYFFYGVDEYSKMKKIKSLVDLVIVKGFEEFDYSKFEGRGLDVATLINAASSPPFGSPLRIVLVRNFDKTSPKNLKLIESFIEKIPDYTTLVLTSIKASKTADGKNKLDKRKKIYKKLFKNKLACIEFVEPEPALAVKNVLDSAKEFNIEMSPDVAAYLVETVGCDIGRLDQELKKLELYCDPESKISKDDIALVSGSGALGTVFDLPEKIVDGDIGGALVLVTNLLSTRQPMGTILFRTKEYFLNLNMVKLHNMPVWSLMKNYHLLKKTAESLLESSKKLSSTCITNCLHVIYDGETALKSSGLKNEIVLMDMVSRLGAQINGNKM